MFIQVENKLVNLEKVSSIRVLKDKIFFNMNYSINITDKFLRNVWISDYVDTEYSDELATELNMLRFIQDNFFKDKEHFIGLSNISSIKREDDKLKICVNFSNPISFGQEGKITSEFYFINCKDISELDHKYNKLLTNIVRGC